MYSLASLLSDRVAFVRFMAAALPHHGDRDVAIKLKFARCRVLLFLNVVEIQIYPRIPKICLLFSHSTHTIKIIIPK